MEETFIIKPNRSIMIGKAVLGIVFLGGFFLACLFAILNPNSLYSLKMGLLSWIAAPVCLWFMVTIIIRSFPGQGELILDREGFELKDWASRAKKKYRWSDVVGFYVKITYVKSQKFHHVFFDVNYTNQQKQLSNYSYNYTNEQLARMLNDWKAKYAANPEGVELTPRLDATPEKGPSFLKRAGIQIGMVVLVGIVMWVYFAYFATLDIQIRNNTAETIRDIAVTTFKTDTKQTNRFHIASLQPGQEAELKTPFLEFGIIKVKYGNPTDAAQQSSCTLLQHQKCTWGSNDIVFLEPHGQVVTNGTYCKSFQDLAPVASAPCNPNVDAKMNEASASVKEVNPKPIENAAPKKPETAQAYIETLKREVEKHFHPPTIKYTSFPVVVFTIHKNGSIDNIKLKAPSQNQGLDDAALNAIYAIKRLPPFPPDLKDASVNTEFEFDFMAQQKSRAK